MGEEPKRRRLRLGDEPSSLATSAKLYNFDNSNDLLYQDKKIAIDTSPEADTLERYTYYKERCELPRLPKRNALIVAVPSVLSRRRKHKVDPLSDDVYTVFHRRMMKDERSSTMADKSRIMFEMDNLRTQYELLKQHDWPKHLPVVTRIIDRNDDEELQRKRKLTLMEMERTFSKFSNWEVRNALLASEIRAFEYGTLETADDLDMDEDESILKVSPEQILNKRSRERARKDGLSFRLHLGNGFDIVSNPHLLQRVSIQATVPAPEGTKRLKTHVI